MTRHNALANCQSNAVSRVFLCRVQPFENFKDALQVLGLDANAVIRH